MILGLALTRLYREEVRLADTFRAVADHHPADRDLAHLCMQLASECDRRAEGLRPFADKHGALLWAGFRHLGSAALGGARRAAGQALTRSKLSGLVLLLDLRRLHRQAQGSAMDWVLVREAAHAARDPGLRDHAASAGPEKEVQIRWIKTRLKQIAAQVLVFS
jgi:hypothetical protein